MGSLLIVFNEDRPILADSRPNLACGSIGRSWRRPVSLLVPEQAHAGGDRKVYRPTKIRRPPGSFQRPGPCVPVSPEYLRGEAERWDCGGTRPSAVKEP